MIRKTTVPRHQENEIDSLNAYLHQIRDLEPLPSSEQHRLFESFFDALHNLRILLNQFGFAASEHLRFIAECSTKESDPYDLFLPSSLKDPTQTPEERTTRLSLWGEEISALYARQKEAFQNGSDLTVHRTELYRLLDRYPLNFVQINEFLEALNNYCRYLNPDFDLARRKLVLPENVETPLRELVEKRLLFHLEELPDHLLQIADALHTVDQLRAQLVETNLRLVISIAQRHRERGIHLNDLIQEGNLGLLKALERFDLRLGYKFSTYASWWIRHNISRVIAEQSRIIRLPAHMIQLIREINRAEQRYLQLHGEEPEIAELAEMLHLPPARISAVRKMSAQTISLQAPVSAGEDGSVLEEIIADENSPEPSGNLAKKILYERLYAMMRTLPEREQQILIMRFGFFGQSKMPLNEISKRFNLTRERIRQIEIKILNTLRSPERLKFIDNCSHTEEF